MNLQQIEAIENKLIRNVLATCWNIAEDVAGGEVYGCDIHHYLFNSEYYTDNIWQAELDTVDLGVWDCLQLVHNYEKRNYGEFGTKIEPFAIANMVYYILGEKVLNGSEHLQDEAWNEYATADDLATIQAELRAYIEGLTDWRKLWGGVCEEYNV